MNVRRFRFARQVSVSVIAPSLSRVKVLRGFVGVQYTNDTATDKRDSEERKGRDEDEEERGEDGRA